MADKNKKVERSREGTPIWDGDASTFQEFEEMALVWEQATPHHKRYLAAPKLIAELQGSAKRYVVGKHPEWVSHPGGVQKLLVHLRQSLGMPQMPELTEHLSRFFKQSKRRRGESMNEYVTRKSEIYARARQGLDRVLKQYGRKLGSRSSSMAQSGTTRQDPWQSYQWRQPWRVPEESTEEEFQEARDPLPEEGESSQDGDAPRAASQADTDWWSTSWTQDHGWWSGSWHSSSWPTSQDADWVHEAPELLPDFVQGWYLLYDAGLSTNERNLVAASLKQDFAFDRVAQELRNQWPDEDLKKRDLGHHGSGMWMDHDEIDDDDLSYYEDSKAYSLDQYNDEGQELIMAAEEDAQKAMALVEQGRRTLKEARAKQHQVRMSRKYFRTSFRSSNYDSKGSKGKAKCFKCGGDHPTSTCPKSSTASASVSDEQAAPFMCYADLYAEASKDSTVEVDSPQRQEASEQPALLAQEEGFTAGEKISTRTAVQQGKAVIDGGATKTIGSVVALERIMALNQEKSGSNGLSDLDLEDRPVFGFGNSSRNQCLSTALFKIMADGKDGQVKIHALNEGDGPVLFSIESLRALGAVLDFSADLICFRKLNDRKIIPLERSNTGHQLLPMTQDWYSGAKEVSEPVRGLDDLI